MAREHIPESTKRILYLRSHGRCEYLNCSRVVARFNEDQSIHVTGEFCHILPAGDGPRSEFAANQEVDRSSSTNILFLCREHHRLVDHEAKDSHPPDFLFAMAARRFLSLENGIDELLLSNPSRFGHEELANDLRISRTLALINDYCAEGPRQGKSHLDLANKLLAEIEENPYIIIPDEVFALIRIEIIVLHLRATYLMVHWRQALRKSTHLLNKISDPPKIVAAAILFMVFVRDEYNSLEEDQRLKTIKLLTDKLDEFILHSSEVAALKAISLSTKAGLLRWRGRIERGSNRSNSYGEAERCVTKSLDTVWTPAGQLQRGLVRFARSFSLPREKRRQFMDELALADADIMDSKIDDFPAAIKYRSRYLRDSHNFSGSMKAFLKSVDSGFLRDMQPIAFVLGESAASSRIYGLEMTLEMEEVNGFLADAIVAGFDHGRNLMSWIVTRALVETDWFRCEILERIEGKDKDADLASILSDTSRRFLGNDVGSQDILFGISEIEFWCMMARTCLVVLEDPVRALQYYRVAERYSGRPGGNFTTKSGFVRAHLRLGDINGARKYLGMAKSTALAHQMHIIDHLYEAIESASP